MKRFFMMALLFSALVLPIAADYDPDTDYMAEMISAAQRGDVEAGSLAEQKRAEKMEGMGLTDYPEVKFEELYLLSKIIYAEAGCSWLPMDWKMSVGEVVLNRVASPEFPNTMREVLEQPGQYYGKNSDYFDGLLPSAPCVEAAKRLLEGERVLNEPAVVFQSNYRLGSGVYLERRDVMLGSTYFCWSSYPEKYEV